LGYLGHVLMENRNGLIVGAMVTHADGTAERDAAGLMLDYELRKRPLIEKAFGWMKQTGGMRKTKLRGLLNVSWQFLMTAAAFNLWRLPKLRTAEV